MQYPNLLSFLLILQWFNDCIPLLAMATIFTYTLNLAGGGSITTREIITERCDSPMQSDWLVDPVPAVLLLTGQGLQTN